MQDNVHTCMHHFCRTSGRKENLYVQHNVMMVLCIILALVLPSQSLTDTMIDCPTGSTRTEGSQHQRPGELWVVGTPSVTCNDRVPQGESFLVCFDLP